MSAQRTTVCIIQPNREAYSETFIRGHIQHLPAKVHVLWGAGALFCQHEHDRPLVPRSLSLAARVWTALPRCFGRTGAEAGDASIPRLDAMGTHMLARFLTTRRIDAVLAEYGQTGVQVREACLRAQVPLIVHFHGADAHSRKILDQYLPDYQKLFHAAGAVIAVSRLMRQQLRDLGAPAEKIHYGPCGVDIDLFRSTQPDRNEPLFIAVGRFVDKKAPHLTLLAFKKVLDAFPQARLCMIGDGPLREACRQIASTCNMTAAVSFAGRQPHAEVVRTMCTARCFVQHSVTTALGDKEGTPVAILEAGASGLPTVSTRHAGISDVVIDNETGFLVDEFDVDGMARHMLRLAQDPGLARDMGRRARLRIEEQFSMRQSIDHLWAVIAGCIATNPRRATAQ
jgi:glycosyltransferase involved in cell wall biosynthesis